MRQHPISTIEAVAEKFMNLSDDKVVESCSSPEAAALVVDGLEQLRRDLQYLIGTYRAQLAKVVDAAGGAVEIDGAKVYTRPKWKVRYDHDRIGERVVVMATKIMDGDEIVGTVDDPEEAARRAVALMRKLYLAPSSEPKKGELIGQLKFETMFDAVLSREADGREVQRRAK